MSHFRSAFAQLTQDRHVVGYASGNFGKAIFLGSIDVTLLFLLTDIIAIPAREVSLLMLVVLAGDLAFDLGAGIVAARAERLGIAYPRLIARCVLPCALAFASLYALPLLHTTSFVLIVVLLLTLRASFALIDVPHNSLLARITTDSHARGRASGYRTLFSAAASVIVATVVAPAMHVADGSVTAVRLAWLGVGAGLIFCTTLLVSAWSSRAACPPCAVVQPSLPRKRLFPQADRLYGAIAAIALVTGFAVPMFGKTMLYVCTYVLHDAALAGRVLLTLAMSQIAGATLWITLVRHVDKTRLLAASHGLAAAGIALFALTGDQRNWLYPFAALAGIGLAGVFMLPWGILADVIDFAEFRYRERRETMVFAIMLVLLKGGGAAALATLGWMLAALGYAPGAVQPAEVVFGMKLLAFGLPVSGSIVAIAILLRLDIGHARHARVRWINRVRKKHGIASDTPTDGLPHVS
jgi:GPH family glycoside/pentoside/hexuronide:cation symporter